jgi:hypothetical protein
LTEIYHLLGMKSFRDDLIDRMKTGWGRFVLASRKIAFPIKRRIICERKAVISFLMRRSIYICNLTREAIYTRGDAGTFIICNEAKEVCTSK